MIQWFSLLAALLFIQPVSPRKAAQLQYPEKRNRASVPEVYFTADISSAGVLKIFEYVNASVSGKVALKVHFGEEGNQNYLKPDLCRELAIKLGATLVETNVLYVSKRRYTASHIQLAKDHGFDFAPIDILDSEGEKELPCNTKHYSKVRVGSHIDNYDTWVIFSHFKGHGLSGFGGAIKNVAMGLASVSGKMAMHASTIPACDNSKCISCGACVKQCPAGAITLSPLKIDSSKCIGCGKCIGECPVRAINVPWGSTEQPVFLERLVEYASVITSYKKNFIYINVLASISKDCDCASRASRPFIADIGILASTDIVALEKASHDLVDKAHQCNDAFVKENSVSGKRQIIYAHELGMGSIKYRLVDIDKK